MKKYTKRQKMEQALWELTYLHEEEDAFFIGPQVTAASWPYPNMTTNDMKDMWDALRRLNDDVCFWNDPVKRESTMVMLELWLTGEEA